MKAIFLCESEPCFRSVYSAETMRTLCDRAGAPDKVFSKAEVLSSPGDFADTEYVFSTWNMPVFTEEEIRTALPSLRCLFYGAGSVQGFAEAFLACGVKVFSAWAANGIPVAEFTVAQIVLANKGFFAASRLMSRGDTDLAYTTSSKYPGNYGAKVGIIGAGMIGKMVIRMLKEYRLDCLVYDKFMSEEDVAALGARKCTLEEIFSQCSVVSNHLADNPRTKGMLTGELFSKMLPYSTFINTGRGAQVVESELCEVLRVRPDITALLDVTDPEPPAKGSPFFTLENCILSPHMAGSKGFEINRMAKYMAEEFERFDCGRPCLYEVTEEMLQTMA